MTPRDVVRRTLEFDSPPRLARQLWVLPWAESRYPDHVNEVRTRFPDDITGTPIPYIEPPLVSGDPYSPGTYVDDWGCVFENLQPGIIGEVKKPQLADWSQLDGLRFPIERHNLDVAQINAFCQDTDRYVMAGTCPRLFEQLQFIRGTENVLIDLLDRPPELEALITRMREFYIRELEIWATSDVDALSFMDDWGSQRSLLISPALWRELFKPIYRDFIQIAHQAGKAIFMHSDGYIADIIPDLIELGLDAINSQIFCMDVDKLGDQFAGKITFWGELDRQQIIPNGTRAEVFAAVEQMYKSLYRDGGLIAQCEFGPGADPENIIAYYEAWEAIK
jgi:uroporphyrinogen decarboxylase